MNDETLFEMVREADPFPATAVVGEHSAAILERILALARAEPMPGPAVLQRPRLVFRARAHALRRRILRRRLALGLVCAVVLVGAIVAVAVFPGSPNTSSGLSTISNRGTPASFVAGDSGWGKAYVLAELGGFVYFRIEKPKDFAVPPGMTNRPTCYGRGKLRGGQIEVFMVDCSAFPSAQTPVLKWVSIDASDRSGGGTLLEVEGIAADGVAKMRLVSDDGHVIATAPVNANVFRFESVTGLGEMDVKLVAVDPGGREVWSGPG
jgi:hypothetical protein